MSLKLESCPGSRTGVPCRVCLSLFDGRSGGRDLDKARTWLSGRSLQGWGVPAAQRKVLQRQLCPACTFCHGARRWGLWVGGHQITPTATPPTGDGQDGQTGKSESTGLSGVPRSLAVGLSWSCCPGGTYSAVSGFDTRQCLAASDAADDSQKEEQKGRFAHMCRPDQKID